MIVKNEKHLKMYNLQRMVTKHHKFNIYISSTVTFQSMVPGFRESPQINFNVGYVINVAD